MSGSLGSHGLKPNRLLYPWDYPGKNTGVIFHFRLQGIFLTQGSNLCLLCFLIYIRRCFTTVPPNTITLIWSQLFISWIVVLDSWPIDLPPMSTYSWYMSSAVYSQNKFSKLKPKLCLFFFFLFSSSTSSDCIFKSSLTTKTLSTLSKMLTGNKILLLYSQKYTWTSFPPLCSWKVPSFLLCFILLTLLFLCLHFHNFHNTFCL